MNFTTTLTSKNQLTLPKAVRERINIKKGTQFDIYPTPEGGFIGVPKRKSKIMEYAGDLKHLDDGKSWQEIREETDRIMAKAYLNQSK